MFADKMYAHNLPNIGSYINFIFTSREETILYCHLIDYDIDAIMHYKFLTSKKKIKSINKLAPLNKPLIGLVESIDDGVVSLNLVHVDNTSDEYKLHERNNNSLYFLKKILRQYSKKNNIDYANIMVNHIFPLDIMRVEQKSEHNLLDYIVENNMNITDEILRQYIIESYEIFNNPKTFEIITDFKFISTGGVEYTKLFFQEIISNYQDVDINILTSPTYQIYSNTNRVSKDTHKNIMDLIKEKSKTFEPKVFVA